MSHTPLTLKEFNGLFDRGHADAVPPDHFAVAQNIRYDFGEFRTRGGLTKDVTVSNLKRVQLYTRTDTQRRLYRTYSAGNTNIYDENYGPAILTKAGDYDFSAFSMYNRVYITLHNRVAGITGEFIYVYLGDGVTARKIGGTAPATSPTCATSATAGDVEAGLHLIGVCYETNSGFITMWCTPVQYTAPGGQKIDLTVIPTGASHISARHIVATKVITSYSGRPEDYEFFFVPSGKINDNVTTILTINFFDNDLIASADYLQDQLSEVPAGVCLTSYQGSLISGGEYGKESVVRVSKPGDPESFSDVDGFILVNPGDAGFGVKNVVEYRDLLHIFKSQRAYVSRNNGSAPSTWDVALIDGGIGTECYGTSIVLDFASNTSDRFIIADRSGVIVYDGTFSDKPLTWKIHDTWKRVNQLYFNQIQIGIDPVHRLIFVNVPLDAATSPSHVLVCDYSSGLAPESVRWSIDSYHVAPTSIYIRSNRSGVINPSLEFGSAAGNIYIQNPDFTVTSDDGNAIDSQAETTKLAASESGDLSHFAKIHLRVTGSGSLAMTCYSLDDVYSASPAALTLSSSPGKEIYRLINFVNERMSVRFRVNTLNHWFKIARIVVMVDIMYRDRVQ